MNRKIHHTQFCVIGGGLAGLCAALAAARHGVKTILVQDRPVLGGNASSEIRMWVCGAHHCLETGIIEELRLENCHINAPANYSIWDSVLYGKARYQDNLTLLLNTSCRAATVVDGAVKTVTAWQLTTYIEHEITAELFADCSGDSVLAPLTGAQFRVGREAQSEFGESIAPETADRHTMGLSCLLQARETAVPQPYRPPEWAYRYEDETAFAHRPHHFSASQNFWWLELGGDRDSIQDTEAVRDELLKTAFGLWDHIKNHGDHGAENWVLDWVGFLPGKRESRRYVGDYILNENDVRTQRQFPDRIAYGGWTLDDHHPAGFLHPGAPNIHHPCPSPFGIPYRCCYSCNRTNLFFAGRNISVTHAALSSTRVMATCAVLGQAIGTAAAVATRYGQSPREVGNTHIDEIQQLLLDDDCFLPERVREIAPLSLRTPLHGDPGRILHNGRERGAANAVALAPGGVLEYELPEATPIREIRIVFDSDLEREERGEHLNMRSNYPLQMQPLRTPDTLVRGFHLTVIGADGVPEELFRTADNYQRLFRLKLERTAVRVRLEIDAIRGDTGKNNIFAFEIR